MNEIILGTPSSADPGSGLCQWKVALLKTHTQRSWCALGAPPVLGMTGRTGIR